MSDWHNPQNVDISLIPEGWRLFYKGENRLGRSDARIWDAYNKRFSYGDNWGMEDDSHTFIIPSANQSKPPLPDSVARTEPMTKREQILREAIKCTTKDRQQTHGKPENSFADIATLWSWYKDVQFSPQDVAVMMGLMKMARIKSNPVYDDNMVDCAGYIAIAAELGGSDVPI